MFDQAKQTLIFFCSGRLRLGQPGVVAAGVHLEGLAKAPHREISRVLLDEGGDVTLRASTDHLVHDHPVLVKEQGRDGVHAQLLGQGLIGIHVDLYDLDGSIHLGGELIEHGADLLAWADELLLMKDGHIIQQGSPLQVYTQPVNEYAAGLLGEYSLVDAAVLQQPVVTGKKLFLRPDQFHIGTEEEHSYKGIIEAVHYRGAYQLLEVMFQQQRFFILQKPQQVQTGEMLYFHTAPYSAPHEAGLNALDSQIAIPWPLPVSERSNRDQQFSNISSEFTGVHL